MSNLAHERLPEYEEVKQAFLDKGFSEAVFQYVLVRNSNYSYDNLQVRMTVLEKQMVALSGDVKKGIDKLDAKDGAGRSELKGDIKAKIEELKTELNAKILVSEKSIREVMYPIYWVLVLTYKGLKRSGTH
ncbi:Bdr family repetitive protein [Borrelia sp. P9F1]|uniref:Bdr family repetitive protein n=1 Tax=Borrelia sp. P9F1 TaxID=3058374 RepID=UPI002648B3E8|nr:Bdr family repetitive protein [Borrelia sp. P9F1]WKC58560.1 Bdr family repetitive protein [Borrelia sp. P9F1]WKC58648.1 Bdr family repetitive protein [Borrelia sp. P9F1]